MLFRSHTLTRILQAVTQLFPYKSEPVALYLKATMIIVSKHSQIILDCNELDLNQLALALSHSRWISRDFIRLEIYQKLMSRIMDFNDHVKLFKPESASAILWSMTTIFESPHYQQRLDEKDLGQVRRLLFDLFHKIGPLLLVEKLDSLDSSRAMWAMSKAAYTLDTGIFDHLASKLEDQIQSREVPVQHVAQSLWACAKISSWEDPLVDQIGRAHV